MERKQNEGTEKIMIKVAQTIIIIFMDIAWLTDSFCSRFFLFFNVATTTNKTMEKLIK